MSGKDPASAHRTKILAVSSEKGGVGKTTTTANLGATFARWGARVALVDFDPQGQLGVAYGYRPESKRESVCAALQLFNLGSDPVMERFLHDATDAVRESGGTGVLHVLGTTTAAMSEYLDHVTAARRDTADQLEAVTSLRRFLLAHVLPDHDFVLIDTPPTTNALNALALAAADYVIGVSEPQYAAVSGISALFRQVELTPGRTEGRCRPHYLGTLINDSRTRQTVQSVRVKELYRQGAPSADGSGPVSLEPFEAEIVSSEWVSSSYARGLPAVLLHPTRDCTAHYAALGKEVAERITRHQTEGAFAA